MSTPNFQINKNISPLVQLNIADGLDYEGTYSAATAYVAGDVVAYNSNSYVARQNTTGNTPGDTAYWQTLATKGDTGSQGPTGNTGSTGAAATIAVGSTSSVANSGTAAVSNSGSSSAAVFDFVLRDGPTGATGLTGATGAQGAPGVIQTVTAGTNLSGGGSAADVTVNLDASLTGLSAVTSTALTASSTLNLDSVALTTVQTSAESFVDNDVTLMTAAAIEDRYGAGDGDITSVVAGTNLNGGGTSGDVTLNLDTTITGLSSVTSTAFVGALTGNASTAAALQTARNIGGVSFNGTSSIDLPGVNTAGNQATSGLAATATALATARAINGVDFDGTAPITVTAAAGTLTGSTLASGVTASSLTSVGTLSALTVGGTLTFDSVGLTTVQTSAESFVDNDVTLMTAAAAEARYGSAGPGDITGVAAGTNLNGGGTSGDVTLNLDTTLTGLSSVTSTALVGALTGNADTATALATARAINGVDFDGTAPITVTAAAGTLTGGTLASGVTATSITSLGTLGSLTVAGDATFDTSTLKVDSTNNRVGVGTASPESILHLNPGTDLTPDANGVGHIMIDGNTYTSFFTMDGTATWIGNNSNGRALILATDETARLTVLGTGNVGIGTTAPETPLSIVTTNSLGSTFTGTAAGEGLRVDQSDYSSGNYVSLVEASYDDSASAPNVRIGAMFSSTGSNLAFGTSNSYGSGITNTALFINQAGKVGIGTTSPTSALDITQVNPTLTINDSDGVPGGSITAMLEFEANNTVAGQVGMGTSAGNMISWANDGNYYCGTRSNDKTFIRTNDTDRLTIDAAGDATFTGTVFLSTSGDGYLSASPPTGTGNDAEWAAPLGVYVLRRNSSLAAEKENITADLGEHLTADMIDSVTPKLWNRLNSPGYPEIGPLAEDMDAISPFLAARGTDAENVPFLTGINKTAYLSLLVLAVKDLRARVATLESAGNQL